MYFPLCGHRGPRHGGAKLWLFSAAGKWKSRHEMSFCVIDLAFSRAGEEAPDRVAAGWQGAAQGLWEESGNRRRAAMKAMTEQHLAILRRHMVDVIGIHFDLASDELGTDAPAPLLRAALAKVPRHLFVPGQIAVAAYQDTPLPLGFDKTVSQPFIGALMLELLDVRPGDRVLEVGTGFGYQSALLAELGARLWSVEIIEEFAAEAGVRLSTLGYEGISIRVGDGSRGWAEHAPFDKILVTAAAREVPAALAAQLAPGGRMVIPLGADDPQELSVVKKQEDGTLRTTPVLPVRFTRLETA
jgi:protein-L-isoaspartate(D-aspartate) O-methyltransferase